MSERIFKNQSTSRLKQPAGGNFKSSIGRGSSTRVAGGGNNQFGFRSAPHKGEPTQP